MTAAIDAGSYVFQTYKSGVIRGSDNCGTAINHAVVIIGYSDVGDSTPTPPEPEVEPEVNPEVNPDQPTEPTCSVTKWWRNCDAPARRALADSDGDEGYFKVQNSWGIGWGDEGFVKIAIEEGSGPCEINSYMYYVDWQ